MRTFLSILLISVATSLLLALVPLYFLDRLSTGYKFSATSNSYSADSKTHYERYIQFTQDSGVLLFGFKAQDAVPDHPPFSLTIEPLRQDELEARNEYSKTSESRNKVASTLGFSRMIARPAGQNFRGDYISVKIVSLYVVITLALLLIGTFLYFLNRKTEQDAAANA